MDLNSPNTNEADLKIIFQNFLLLNWKILHQKRAWRPRPPIPPDLWDVDNNSQSKLPSQEKVWERNNQTKRKREKKGGKRKKRIERAPKFIWANPKILNNSFW